MRRYSFITMLFGILLIPMISFAQVQTGGFEFEGRMRDYLVFLPQNYDGVTKMPLVFNLQWLHAVGRAADGLFSDEFGS